MNTKERLELAHWVVNTAKTAGVAETAVNIGNSRAVEIEYRDGQLDKVKESTQNSLNIDIYIDNKFSGHSTNDLRKESLSRFVNDAVAMTKYLTEDEFRKLPDPKYYKGIKDIDLDLFDGEYDKIMADQRVKYASDLQNAVSSKSDKIITSTS